MTTLTLAAALELPIAIHALRNVKVPIGLSLKLRALAREVDAIAQDYDEERLALLKQYAQLDDAGQFIVNEDQTALFVSYDARDQFAAALHVLREQDVEIRTSIQPSNFGTAEVEPAIVLALGDILTDN